MSVAFESKESSARTGLAQSVESAGRGLLNAQRNDGHWAFPLEADATIPAEYVLLRHYRGEPVDTELERKIANYLRRIQGTHGGWGLFHNGAFDVSASVKAYFALKMIGDSPDAPHMARARGAILMAGGAAASNVFTRAMLALFDILRWQAVPEMPIEIMLLPCWFPFHLSKVSYWARTVLVPLLVLQTLRPAAKNPRRVGIDELFVEPPNTVGPAPRAPHQSRLWHAFFGAVDRVLRVAVPFFPRAMRQRAIDRAVMFVTERLNGEDGLGAIFPAMANATMVFDALGDEAHAAIARGSLEKLLIRDGDEAYCQPCVSPVWDTALACHAMLEMGDDGVATAQRGLDWLKPRQVLDVVGDWSARRPDARPGGWAFQYANPHYPDLDDTAVVVMAMDRARRLSRTPQFDEAIARGAEWIEGLQSSDGGWAAFDVDNNFDYLNNIPFADHGALIDPPTEDVTARCLSMLAQLGRGPNDPVVARGLDYLRRTQLPDGSWYGRWGVNYIYGTWSVLCALNACGLDRCAPEIRKANDWLISIQNADGGWGEDCTSYKLDYRGYEPAESRASQTAWALLGLMAGGEAGSASVARGIQYLQKTQKEDGLWDEADFTGTGFPRVFYLRYHGYAKFFPLWALARYRTAKRSGHATPFGM
ncbi:MAG: squalene--hopene cyclase [Pseudolabrys sp.]|nr:squalene--hopene cyclase [Pseudolabrys sp.]